MSLSLALSFSLSLSLSLYLPLPLSISLSLSISLYLSLSLPVSHYIYIYISISLSLYIYLVTKLLWSLLHRTSFMFVDGELPHPRFQGAACAHHLILIVVVSAPLWFWMNASELRILHNQIIDVDDIMKLSCMQTFWSFPSSNIVTIGDIAILGVTYQDALNQCWVAHLWASSQLVLDMLCHPRFRCWN